MIALYILLFITVQLLFIACGLKTLAYCDDVPTETPGISFFDIAICAGWSIVIFLILTGIGFHSDILPKYRRFVQEYLEHLKASDTVVSFRSLENIKHLNNQLASMPSQSYPDLDLYDPNDPKNLDQSYHIVQSILDLQRHAAFESIMYRLSDQRLTDKVIDHLNLIILPKSEPLALDKISYQIIEFFEFARMRAVSDLVPPELRSKQLEWALIELRARLKKGIEMFGDRALTANEVNSLPNPTVGEIINEYTLVKTEWDLPNISKESLTDCIEALTNLYSHFKAYKPSGIQYESVFDKSKLYDHSGIDLQHIASSLEDELRKNFAFSLEQLQAFVGHEVSYSVFVFFLILLGIVFVYKLFQYFNAQKGGNQSA